jgi:multidrug efflux system membrane fusion protein
MERTLATHEPCAASNPRCWLAAACALGCMLILLAGCSKSGDHHEPKRETTETPKAQSPGTVDVKADLQQILHLKIVALSAASAPPEFIGYGRVLDPTPLAALVSEWAVARAAAHASDQDLERTKILHKQNTASVRALQSAESTAERDRLSVEAIRDRISLSWGRVIARRPDLSGLLGALTAQDRVLVRVELPAGEAPTAPPHRARLAALSDTEKTIEAEFLGPVPATDPQLQGQGFLFLTHHNALNLTPGAAVTAYLELGGEALSGVWVPASALLRYDSRLWVYTQHSETSFVRTPVVLGPPGPNGWLITQGVRPDDKVVTQGAQVLLSEELKPQTSLPD